MTSSLGVKRCTQCGFDGAPEHFRESLCSACADKCEDAVGYSYLHHVYDRYETRVQWRQRVMTLDEFYKERRRLNPGGRRSPGVPKVDATNFSIIHPVLRDSSSKRQAIKGTHRGARLS